MQEFPSHKHTAIPIDQSNYKSTDYAGESPKRYPSQDIDEEDCHEQPDLKTVDNISF